MYGWINDLYNELLGVLYLLGFNRVVSVIWPLNSFAVSEYCCSHDCCFLRLLVNLFGWFWFFDCSGWILLSLTFYGIVSVIWPLNSFAVFKYCSSHNFCFRLLLILWFVDAVECSGWFLTLFILDLLRRNVCNLTTGFFYCF